MKKIASLLLLLVATVGVYSQDITGQWNGALSIQGIQLRIVFHISGTENGFTATMDSPDQGVTGIPVTSVVFERPDLKLKIVNAGIEYNGVFSDTIVTGTFRQAGQSFPLNLKREQIEKAKLVRPQEPVKPYSYYSEEVTFRNEKAGIKLAGTLTMPQKEGNFPAVILITGSGPQNRDEELLGHKPFLVLSDYLTKNGIAVLRYDDRGTAQSEGDFKAATSMDLSQDVEAAIAFLKTRKEININKIGLIGHSEGGIIAPMVASKSKDVKFIVLMAGTGIRGDKLLLLQQELIGRASGASESDLQKSKEMNTEAFGMVLKSTGTQKLKPDLTAFIKQKLIENPGFGKSQGMSDDEFIKGQVEQITSPWMLFFIKYDPETALVKVKCPVLAINGEKDLQVPPKENLQAIKTSLKKGGNKNVTIKEFPGLNHLFQECKTGSPEEYARIEQTISPVVLEEIAGWIKVL